MRNSSPCVGFSSACKATSSAALVLADGRVIAALLSKAASIPVS